ncbi:MAG: hypothetical protein AAFR60_09995, partial [Pseudomonadota bacterium]
ALLVALLGLVLVGSSLSGAQASERMLVDTSAIEAASPGTAYPGTASPGIASSATLGVIAISTIKLPQATMIAPQPKLSPIPVQGRACRACRRDCVAEYKTYCDRSFNWCRRQFTLCMRDCWYDYCR